MRLVLFANGWLEKPISLRPDDFVIAADGGARHCLELGIVPAVVIGDLDSLAADDVETLRSARRRDPAVPSSQGLHRPGTGIAVRRASTRRPGDHPGGPRARWDQTLANVLLPAALPDRRISLIDGRQEIHYLVNDESLQIQGSPGDTVSLLALSDEARGVTTRDLEYPLSGETLYFGSTRGVSNVMLSDHAGVSLLGGRLVVTVLHQKAD